VSQAGLRDPEMETWEAPMVRYGRFYLNHSIISSLALVPPFKKRLCGFWVAAALMICGAGLAAAQAITIDTSGKGTTATLSGSPVDHKFQQIEPTHVDFPTTPMGDKNRLEVIRIMQAEQGFAMRPLPKGHKGLILTANGKLEPAGEPYVNMVTSEGLSVQPGGRVVITNIKIDHNKIIFDLNGGPDPKHRFLRHIELGTNPNYTNPVVSASENDAMGSRVTITFKDRVPELTGAQVKALLAPLISFDVKSPVQAYTDTLPKSLKDAIVGHQVLVGMSTDMVMFSKGQPKNKMREMDGQMPIEIWLYGEPPQDVTFVRINGNRVIRVDLAKVGKPVQVFEKDVVTPMLEADGRRPLEQAQNVRVVKEGDVQRDPERQSPAAPPTLAAPGETLPTGSNGQPGTEMKPVHFPRKQPAAQPGANPDDQEPAAGQPASQTEAGQQNPQSAGPSQQK
jgi:hypothetical protein